MGLPIETAKQIKKAINKRFGHRGFVASVESSENQVVVRTEEQSFRFNSDLMEFAEIVGRWSFSIFLQEGQMILLVW
jgi:hypothetical protein